MAQDPERDDQPKNSPDKPNKRNNDERRGLCLYVFGIPLWEGPQCAEKRRADKKERQGQRQENREDRVIERNRDNVAAMRPGPTPTTTGIDPLYLVGAAGLAGAAYLMTRR